MAGSQSDVLGLHVIDVEDLQYMERDLCYYELVSLGFLLFGNTRGNTEFILQKLLVLSNNAGPNGRASGLNGDLLRKYATTNPSNWRATLIEALTIIDARRVLRKLGFKWEPLRQHYLPHIAELSLHVHPLLKALYKICDRLTQLQTGRLILDINEQHQRKDTHLRFYDSKYLEVYLLHWMTRSIITVGDSNANGANVQVLIDYFKLNEMHSLKALLMSTINFNAAEKVNNASSDLLLSNGISKNDEQKNNNCNFNTTERVQPVQDCTERSKSITMDIITQPSSTSSNNASNVISDIDLHERYLIRREHAGLILIINQKEFYNDTSPELQHLLPPKKLSERKGTDVDKQRLKNVFTSFGYTLVDYENLKHTEMLYRIDETVQRSFLFDSLIVCILSHGIDGAVYGSNSIPVEISDIEKIITSDTLEGKPKMLIIQACQRDDEAPRNIPNKNKKRTAPDSVQLTHLTDMIKAMSTVPGYAAMRHTIDGTWFIDSLCKITDRLGDRKHMLDILTVVQRDVSSRRGNNNELMVSTSSFTLTKDFFLPPRNTTKP